jgi:hypothetical protein
MGLADRCSKQIGQVSFMYFSALEDLLLLLLFPDDLDPLLLLLAGLEKILDSPEDRFLEDEVLSPPRRILRVILLFERKRFAIYIY